MIGLLPIAAYFSVIYLIAKSSPKSTAVDFLSFWARLIVPLITFAIVFVLYKDLAKSAIFGIGSYFLVNAITGEPRIHFTKLLQAIVDGSKSALGVAVACATAGMIVGVVTMTGLGLKLGTGLVELSGNQLLLTMFFTMITSIILGMGVPTTANYVITSTIAAPAIISLIGSGQALAAHLFVFYFGIIADVTPPVALAAFAGAGIAKADPFKTGVNATKLSIAAFMVPYCFVYNTNLLMINQSFFSFITIFNLVTAFLGMMFIAVGVQGWLKTISPWWERILAIIGGLAMIGGSQFLHGVMEIFKFIKPIEAMVVNAKDFFYSLSGEFLINGIGLVIIVIVYLAQTTRKRKYGEMSQDQIYAMLQAK
ncbi:MAG: TRAP transporter large permease subunit [Firmicutes bacterium]|nr:TRAP transporter large permease subunit [Bacillota bacterium]